MNQTSSLSIVNRSILRDSQPFKNETPEVFKFLTNMKTYTDASTMNESFTTAPNMSKTTTAKYSTLDVSRKSFVPEVKKKEFVNPYFFVSVSYHNPHIGKTTKDWRRKIHKIKLFHRVQDR